MSRRADPRKQQLWLQHIRRWQRSRLTVADFCEHYQLGEASFYSWRRTLQQRGLLAESDTATTAHPGDGADPSTPLFLPVTVADPGAAPGSIEIVLPDGLAVRVAAGFDATTLRQLLALLREQPC
jgi:hypothetical protein